MARIFKVTIELWDKNEIRPNYCIETFETVRTAKPNRVLHFGIAEPVNLEDVTWVEDTIGAEIRSLFMRTVGIQEELNL